MEDLRSLFDFENIRSEEESAVVKDNMLFYKSNNKRHGTIERDGDLFFGIKNNENYIMKVIIDLACWYDEQKDKDGYIINIDTNRVPPNYYITYQTLYIKPGEIGYLRTPLIPIRLTRINRLRYKIEKVNSEICDFFYTTYKTDFIYGYVSEDMRRDLCDNIIIYENECIAYNLGDILYCHWLKVLKFAEFAEETKKSYAEFSKNHCKYMTVIKSTPN